MLLLLVLLSKKANRKYANKNSQVRCHHKAIATPKNQLNNSANGANPNTKGGFLVPLKAKALKKDLL